MHNLVQAIKAASDIITIRAPFKIVNCFKGIRERSLQERSNIMHFMGLCEMCGYSSIKLLLPPGLVVRVPCGVSHCSSIRSIQKHVYDFDWTFPSDASRAFARHFLSSIEMTGPSSSILDFPILKLTSLVLDAMAGAAFRGRLERVSHAP